MVTTASSARALLASASVLGASLGIVSFAIHAEVHGEFSVLGRAGAPWLAGAFAVGASAPGPTMAVLGGLTVTGAASAGYYLTLWSWYHHLDTPSALFAFACLAVVGGALLGTAGHGSRHRHRHRHRRAWWALGGALIAEGLMNLRAHTPDPWGWGAEAIFGLGIVLAAYPPRFVLSFEVKRPTGAYQGSGSLRRPRSLVSSKPVPRDQPYE